MAFHHTAQGLASLGRHGDSVLVHMQPEEVAGLQALARANGTSLSINPHTGMPEAFSLGGLFKSLLPVAAGFLLGPGGFGLFDSALMTGLAVGGVTALASGNLGKGLMAGLGAGGGFGLGETLKNAGSQFTKSIADNEIAQGATKISSGAIPGSVENISMYTPTGEFGKQTMGAALETGNPYSSFASAQAGTPVAAPQPYMNAINTSQTVPSGGGFGGTFGQNIGQVGKGLQYAYNNPSDFLKMAGKGDMLKGAFNVGLPLAGPVLAGMEPEQLTYPTNKNKYDPYATLNLGQDTGLRLVAEGGYIDKYATGGTVNSNQATVSTGGIQDLYGTNDNSTGATSLSQDGYGIGRLDKLAQQGSLTKAGDMFYAAGGPVSFADGGSTVTDASNLNNLPTLNLNTGESSSTAPASNMNGFLNIFNGLMGKTTPSDPTSSAINTGGLGIFGVLLNSNPALAKELASIFGVKLPATESNNTSSSSSNSTSATIPNYMNPIPGVTGALYPTGPDYGAYQPTSMGTYELKKAAKGGYLDGPGDGLSDSIPATIEGNQPARLADGEFVVSADVVSGLGNGSSKAGAKKLYAMMDRVREQAHGSKKQIRHVNEKQVMPV
jgi:hypothetical protein